MNTSTYERFVSPILSTGLGLILVAGLSACAERETAELDDTEQAQEVTSWGEWNTDANDELTADEWSSGFRNTTYYDDWDTDNDVNITEEEFERGLFGFLDADNDGAIVQDDWEDAEAWLSEQAANWDDWDGDGDGEITEEEWTTGWNDAGVWDEWDADASGDLDDDEFAEGFFGVWDENDDDVLTQNEFDRADQELGLDETGAPGQPPAPGAGGDASPGTQQEGMN